MHTRYVYVCVEQADAIDDLDISRMAEYLIEWRRIGCRSGELINGTRVHSYAKAQLSILHVQTRVS